METSDVNHVREVEKSKSISVVHICVCFVWAMRKSARNWLNRPFKRFTAHNEKSCSNFLFYEL